MYNRAIGFKALMLLSLVMLLSGCVSKPLNPQLQSGITEEITEKNLPDITAVLKSSGLNNVDIFENWVKDFHESSEYDSNAGFSDADCRMTAMLLAGDLISYTGVEEEYNGDYLMFDIDAIENDERYSVLKEKERLFTTLFGETPLPNGSLSDAFTSIWNKHGICVNSNKFSIISIVFSTYENDKAFVGHTGILIDLKASGCGDGYMFVEKIAFGEPFVFTILAEPNALVDLFSSRPDYSVSDDEATPLVFNNSELIGQLKKASD